MQLIFDCSFKTKFVFLFFCLFVFSPHRSALKQDKRDFRAWYGLGQTYEILKMPAYCLYYHSVARSLRPNDSRMIIASGETLEKLERYNDALKCYWKAGALGKLAALYEKLGK